MCKACLCSVCVYNGTISFSVLFCISASIFCPFFFEPQLYTEQKASCNYPKQFPSLYVTWFKIIWTPTAWPSRKLMDRQSLGWFLLPISLLEMCLARKRGWMGGRKRPHVAIYFQTCKWLAIPLFYNTLYQQLNLINRSSYIIFWWHPDPPS